MQLRFEDVDKRFGQLEVIKGFSGEFAQGELVALVGPSGCGKSTLLHLVAGLEKPSAGRVLADGKPITEPSPRRTLVFQEHALYPWLSLQGNVAMALELQGVAKARPSSRRVSGSACRAQRLRALLSPPGFWRYASAHRPGPSFIAKPEVLLLDEPFGALDALTRMALQDVLRELIEEHQPTVLLVTHDVDEALYLADHVLVFSPRPTRVLKTFNFTHCEKSHDLSAFAAERKEILSLLGIKTEVAHP